MPTYDVFLSYNSDDRPAVQAIATRLRDEARLRPFLDTWHLIPGDSWIPALEQALERSRTIAVFFGSAGVGAWREGEKQLALDMVNRSRQEQRRVIPVLLPGANEDDVEGFMRLRSWVDLATEDGFLRLIAGIKGQTPGDLAGRVAPSVARLRAAHSRSRAPRERQVDKLTLRQFTCRLDRRTAWGELLAACNDHHHLVTWGIGDSKQSLDLFYERIKDRLRDHDFISFGHAFGAGVVAEEWADWMTESVLRRRGGSMVEAVRTASEARHVMFLLDNQRGPLSEDALGKEYIDELVRFVEHGFIPAIARAEPSHAVRLFLAIQTSRRMSKLARNLRTAMGRAPDVTGHQELSRIKPPSFKEVAQSFDALVRPLASLSRSEKAEVRSVYEEVARAGTLRQLAERLYPLYERVCDERMGGQRHGR